MSHCFAFECNHRALRETCKFFRFPKDRKTYKLWRNMSRRKDSEPKSHHRLCSCHFVDGVKSNGPTISIFSRNKARFKSPERRERKKTPAATQSDYPATIVPQILPTISEEVSDVLSTVELPSYDYLLKHLGEANRRIEELQLALKVKAEADLLKVAVVAPGNVPANDSSATDFNVVHYNTGRPSDQSLSVSRVNAELREFYDSSPGRRIEYDSFRQRMRAWKTYLSSRKLSYVPDSATIPKLE